MTMNTFKTRQQRHLEQLERDPAFWAYDASIRWADMQEEEAPVTSIEPEWTAVKTKRPPKFPRRKNH